MSRQQYLSDNDYIYSEQRRRPPPSATHLPATISNCEGLIERSAVNELEKPLVSQNSSHLHHDVSSVRRSRRGIPHGRCDNDTFVERPIQSNKESATHPSLGVEFNRILRQNPMSCNSVPLGGARRQSLNSNYLMFPTPSPPPELTMRCSPLLHPDPLMRSEASQICRPLLDSSTTSLGRLHPLKRRRTELSLSNNMELLSSSFLEEGEEEGEINSQTEASPKQTSFCKQERESTNQIIDRRDRKGSNTETKGLEKSSDMRPSKMYRQETFSGRPIKIDPDAWTIDRVSLLPTALDQLGKSGLLDDSVLEFFFRFLHQYSLPTENRDAIFFFNSYFYSKLLDGGCTAAARHEAVKRWTNRLFQHPQQAATSNPLGLPLLAPSGSASSVTHSSSESMSSGRQYIWEFDVVVVPLNHTGAHWTLALVCFPYLGLRTPDIYKEKGYRKEKVEPKEVSRSDSFPNKTRQYSTKGNFHLLHTGSRLDDKTSQSGKTFTSGTSRSTGSGSVGRRIRNSFNNIRQGSVNLFCSAIFGLGSQKSREKRNGSENDSPDDDVKEQLNDTSSCTSLVESSENLNKGELDIEKQKLCEEHKGEEERDQGSFGGEIMNVSSSDEDDPYVIGLGKPIQRETFSKDTSEIEIFSQLPPTTNEGKIPYFMNLLTRRIRPHGISKPAIFHLDSFEDSPGPPNNLKQCLVEYFQKEFASRCPDYYSKGYHIADDDEWYYVPNSPVPLQENGFDCGVFLIEYIRYLFVHPERLRPLLYEAPLPELASSLELDNPCTVSSNSETSQPQLANGPVLRKRKPRTRNTINDVGSWIEEHWFNQQHVTHRRRCLQQMLIYMQHHPQWSRHVHELPKEYLELLESEFSPNLNVTDINFLRGMFNCSSFSRKFKRLSRKSLESNSVTSENSETEQENDAIVESSVSISLLPASEAKNILPSPSSTTSYDTCSTSPTNETRLNFLSLLPNPVAVESAGNASLPISSGYNVSSATVDAQAQSLFTKSSSYGYMTSHFSQRFSSSVEIGSREDSNASQKSLNRMSIWERLDRGGRSTIEEKRSRSRTPDRVWFDYHTSTLPNCKRLYLNEDDQSRCQEKKFSSNNHKHEYKHTRHRESGNSRHRETGNSRHRETGNSRHRETSNSRHRETSNSRRRETGNSRHREIGNNRHPKSGNSCPLEAGRNSRPRETANSRSRETVNSRPRESANSRPDQTCRSSCPTGKEYRLPRGNSRDRMQPSNLEEFCKHARGKHSGRKHSNAGVKLAKRSTYHGGIHALRDHYSDRSSNHSEIYCREHRRKYCQSEENGDRYLRNVTTSPGIGPRTNKMYRYSSRYSEGTKRSPDTMHERTQSSPKENCQFGETGRAIVISDRLSVDRYSKNRFKTSSPERNLTKNRNESELSEDSLELQKFPDGVHAFERSSRISDNNSSSAMIPTKKTHEKPVKRRRIPVSFLDEIMAGD